MIRRALLILGALVALYVVGGLAWAAVYLHGHPAPATMCYAGGGATYCTTVTQP